MRITNGQDAVNIALEQARNAARDGTFGVGGLMVDNSGQIIATAVNQVIRNDVVTDPTAHVERQLVDWYWDRKLLPGNRLPLPPETTIISSFDPCVMCAGAILRSGFRVISISLDSFAGICHRAAGDFAPLNLPGLETFHAKASRSFGYFGIDGVQPYIGSKGFLAGSSINLNLREAARQTFEESLKAVREKVNLGGPEAIPRAVDTTVYADLCKEIGRFTSQLPIPVNELSPDERNEKLARALIQASSIAHNHHARFDAAALVGPFEDILMVCGDATDQSPTRTAFMELVRNYTTARSDISPELVSCLPHPRHCTFVTLQGPASHDEAMLGFMEFGAFGSAMEGPLPARTAPAWQYVLERADNAFVAAWCAKLPPLYRDVIGVKPVPASSELRAHVETIMGTCEPVAPNHSHRVIRPSNHIFPGVSPA